MRRAKKTQPRCLSGTWGAVGDCIDWVLEGGGHLATVLVAALARRAGHERGGAWPITEDPNKGL
eukprot:4540876-Pyramimonas_sp.AAC.1